MDVNSRTGKAIRNTFVTTGCQVAYLIASFVCRTIFTNMLGKEYLGISGLFTNILTILSFAELGMGSALVYRLYAPLASGNRERVRLFMQLYRKIYLTIITVIAVLGIALIPFLEYLVKAPNVKEDLKLLYCLYLANTIVSYVFVYKKSLLIADQKDYIVSLFTQAFNLVMNVIQCVLLILTHNFVLYCITGIGCSLLNNIVCSEYVNRHYRYLSELVSGKLDREDTEGLVKDVKGLLLTKISETTFNGTDNIFISVFIGIDYVGILSNYTLLLTTVNTLMNKVFGSITAIIGNLTVSKDSDTEHTETVLKRMFFLNTAIYGYLCVGMLLLTREFVTKIWLSEEYTLPMMLVALAIVELFFRSIHYPLYITRNAMGFFSQYNWLFLVAAFMNLLLDYLLVKPLGMSGLYIATILCRGLTYLVDIYVVYHIGFKKSPINYILLIGKWVVFLAVSTVISYQAVLLIALGGIGGFIIRIFVITVVYGMLFLCIYGRSEEWRYYLQLGMGILKKKRG